MAETRGLTAEITIQLPPQRVFDLLTDTAHLECWFCECARTELSAGRYNFWGIHTPGAPYEDDGHARLLGYEEPELLRLGWRIRGADTELEYRLSAVPGSTRLTMHHTNLPARVDPEGSLHDFWYVALENLRLYTATGERQALVDYRPKRGPVTEVAIEVNGTPAQVWDEFANMEQLNRYFGKNATIEPWVGGRHDYGWGPECGPVEILAFEPERRLTYSWHYDGEPDTIVTWQLTGSGGRTRLTISHSGFAEDYDSEGYRAGWFSFLAIIKGMVELGSAWEMVRIRGIEHGVV